MRGGVTKQVKLDGKWTPSEDHVVSQGSVIILPSDDSHVSDPVLILQSMGEALGDRFAISAGRARIDDAKLFTSERDYISGASVKRRAEFGTARVCAHRAIEQLGMKPTALVPNSDRSPKWPSGIKGSISHSNDWCVAVVTKHQSVKSVGIDIESLQIRGKGFSELICTESELSILDKINILDANDMTNIIFSAKESAYKCQYPVTRTILDFRDISLEIDLERGLFSCTGLSKSSYINNLVSRIGGILKFDRFFCVSSSTIQN